MERESIRFLGHFPKNLEKLFFLAPDGTEIRSGDSVSVEFDPDGTTEPSRTIEVTLDIKLSDPFKGKTVVSYSFIPKAEGETAVRRSMPVDADRIPVYRKPVEVKPLEDTGFGIAFRSLTADKQQALMLQTTGAGGNVSPVNEAENDSHEYQDESSVLPPLEDGPFTDVPDAIFISQQQNAPFYDWSRDPVFLQLKKQYINTDYDTLLEDIFWSEERKRENMRQTRASLEEIRALEHRVNMLGKVLAIHPYYNKK